MLNKLIFSPFLRIIYSALSKPEGVYKENESMAESKGTDKYVGVFWNQLHLDSQKHINEN